MQKEKNRLAIKAYYLDSRESRWGYKYLLKGRKHYGYYFPNRRQSLAQSQMNMEDQIGKRLNLPRGSKVLDAGCGEGLVAVHLAKKFGFKIHGIDLLYEPSISEARKNKVKSGIKDIQFSEMDYSNLDFPDQTFDGVYTIETLVHSPDYKKTLKEFHRVLKPGGVVINFEYAMDDKLSSDVESVWKFIYERGSMHTLTDFRMNRMKQNWESCGFKSVTVDDITSHMLPFMKRLYQIAFIPYYTLRLLGREKQHLNTYVGLKSYQKKQRSTFHYVVVRAVKPLGNRKLP